MNAKEAYKKVKKYTNDKIVLSVAKNFLKKNRKIQWIENMFGLKVNQRIELNVEKKYNKKFHKHETIFSFTTGILFKKTFKIRLA